VQLNFSMPDRVLAYWRKAVASIGVSRS
jgi:hypothetical protein